MGQNVKVIVRMRPMLPFEHDPVWIVSGNSLQTFTALPRSQRNLNESKQVEYKFNFESVIGEAISSEQTYKREIRAQLLECFKLRRNISIMAYGQTCSGKTHTILGVKQAPGVIPCVLRDLFLLKQEKDRKCSLKVSYNEIYNEKISDLLDPKQKNIKVTQINQGDGFQLSGTSKQNISTFEDAVKILERGQKRRQYGQGEYHDRSSRSHTILSIFIDEWDSNLQVKSFTISIVDLAGSERLTHQRQSSQEAGYINKSLFQLTNCISKLADKSPHIPFRDSKLTKLLEPSLSGSGRSFIICCVSPSKSCIAESLSTLRLGQRAKKIELKELIEMPSNENEIERLRYRLEKKTKQCNSLKEEVSLLNQKIQQLQVKIKKQKHTDIKNKSDKKTNMSCNLLVLLDHQNFTLFVQDHIKQEFICSQTFQQIKQAFVEKLQSLYQSYTKSVLKHCYGDNFQLQIEELCFMNMVLEHQKIAQYKIQIIEELLRQQDEKSQFQEGRGSMFYNALQQYQRKLCLQNRYADQIPSFHTSNKDYSRQNIDFLATKNIQNSNYSNRLSNTSQNAQVRKPEPAKQVYGTQILLWGCKKDHRVCKGETISPGIIRIGNLGKIKTVVCGYHHTFVITQEGRLFGWGKNTQRQLINCEKESISTPHLINQISKIQSVAAGWGHSLALTLEGKLYSWGYGKDGQLGHSKGQNCHTPTLIKNKNSITSIYAGHSHSAFIDTFGDFYAFGFNQDYRLMIGDQKQVLEPKKISIRDVVKASLGVTHSVIITTNGSVFAGGTGRNGELGVQLNENITGWEKLQVVDREFQDETYQKICPLIQVEGFGRNHRAKDVKCGQNMTIILSQEGEVFTFGKQLSHRLGHGKQRPTKIMERTSAIQCGTKNGFCWNQTQNKLYSWGFNMYGQANPQLTGDIPTPQVIQGLPQRKIITLSSGFLHTALLLE